MAYAGYGNFIRWSKKIELYKKLLITTEKKQENWTTLKLNKT